MGWQHSKYSDSQYILYARTPYVHVPTHSVKWEGIRMHRLANTGLSHFGGNISEIWKLQGKMSYSEGGPSNG